METGGRLTRRGVLAGAGGLAAAGVAAPRAAAAVRRLGEPGPGRAAAEVVARIAQDGDALTAYGYVTHLAGAPDGDLFTGMPHGEGTARLTFFATATVRERFPQGVLVSVVGTGRLGFHLDGGGADLAAPATFARGRRVAHFAVRMQHVATVFAPNQAVSHIEGELHQEGAREFALAGRRSRLGRDGLRLRLTASGQGMRTQPAPPSAVFDVAGHLDLAR
jgi:hypothetical protein